MVNIPSSLRLTHTSPLDESLVRDCWQARQEQDLRAHCYENNARHNQRGILDDNSQNSTSDWDRFGRPLSLRDHSGNIVWNILWVRI